MEISNPFKNEDKVEVKEVEEVKEEVKVEEVEVKNKETDKEYCLRRLIEEGFESNIPVTDKYWKLKQR